jgi:hypothetical protein
MDWPSYKRICDRPDVFSRWMLTQTQALIDDAMLRERLVQAMSTAPIEKPADHKGGDETDMFVVALEVDAVRRIRDALAAAVASGRRTDATRSRGLGGFVAAWDECWRFLC